MFSVIIRSKQKRNVDFEDFFIKKGQTVAVFGQKQTIFLFSAKSETLFSTFTEQRIYAKNNNLIHRFPDKKKGTLISFWPKTANFG